MASVRHQKATPRSGWDMLILSISGAQIPYRVRKRESITYCRFLVDPELISLRLHLSSSWIVAISKQTMDDISSVLSPELMPEFLWRLAIISRKQEDF